MEKILSMSVDRGNDSMSYLSASHETEESGGELVSLATRRIRASIARRDRALEEYLAAEKEHNRIGGIYNLCKLMERDSDYFELAVESGMSRAQLTERLFLDDPWQE